MPRPCSAKLQSSISTRMGQAATAPSPDDAPAPAAMAPTYIAIGKELLLRVAIVRRTLGELTLDSQIRTDAAQILDDAGKGLHQLLHDVEAGNMPTYRQHQPSQNDTSVP